MSGCFVLSFIETRSSSFVQPSSGRDLDSDWLHDCVLQYRTLVSYPAADRFPKFPYALDSPPESGDSKAPNAISRHLPGPPFLQAERLVLLCRRLESKSVIDRD